MKNKKQIKLIEAALDNWLSNKMQLKSSKKEIKKAILDTFSPEAQVQPKLEPLEYTLVAKCIIPASEHDTSWADITAAELVKTVLRHKPELKSQLNNVRMGRALSKHRFLKEIKNGFAFYRIAGIDLSKLEDKFEKTPLK